MGTDAQRFSLVVASQHKGRPHLPQLVAAAKELDAALRDPLRGACAAPLPGGTSLLINKGRTFTRNSVSKAADRAADGDLLILAWIGHGLQTRTRFYVLPKGCDLSLGSKTDPYDLPDHIEKLLTTHPRLSLILLVDACSSGEAVQQAAGTWVGLAGDLRQRFQVLAAANIDDPAYDCAFTRAIAPRLRDGHIGWNAKLMCSDLKRAAEAAELRQQPALFGLDGARHGPDLWVASNAAFRQETGSLPAFSQADLQIMHPALKYFHETPQISAIVTASQKHKIVLVRGGAGHGKTAALGALTRPEVAREVPKDFAQGLRLLRTNEDAGLVARHLAKQLAATTDSFKRAQDDLAAVTPVAQLNGMTDVERYLLSPLRKLRQNKPIRILIDGFDQLTQAASRDIVDLIQQLQQASRNGPDIRIVISARPHSAFPLAAWEISMGDAPDPQLRDYLSRRDIEKQLHDPIITSSNGCWLVASLLADYASTRPTMTPQEIPSGLVEVYDNIVEQSIQGGAAWNHKDSPARLVMTVLAAAGSGAVLPLPLLLDACRRLGFPAADEAELNDRLGPLRRFIVMAPAGAGESATTAYGLFHQSLVDYFTGHLDGGAYSVEVDAGHRALAASLADLAPIERRTPDSTEDPLYDYAERAEANHLWQVRDFSRVVSSLIGRRSSIPAENQRRWQRWNIAFAERFGTDHHDTLTARHHLAAWTGAAGNPEEALKLFTGLAEDLARIEGPKNRRTLAARYGVARWTGAVRGPKPALGLCASLLSDQIRVLGRDDPDTLNTRNAVAAFTSETDRSQQAVELYIDLLADQIRVLGPDSSETLSVRNNLADATAKAGDPLRALELSIDILADRIRLLGADHPHTLLARSNIAQYTHEAGNHERALELYTDLVPDRLRILGTEHPDTLKTRHEIARLTGETGHPCEAVKVYRTLLTDLVHVFGADHPDTREARAELALWRKHCRTSER
ncbi:tetratricopeptide repeat protein [Streptomyces sp. NPDC002073]